PVFREDAVQPPPAHPAAVFEHALRAEIAPAAHAGIDAGAFGEAALADPVAGRVGQLRAFLEIDHEIDRDARPARPIGMRRRLPVADEITGHGCFASGSGYQSSWQISSSV